jgi:small GTP-binding protein
MTRAVATAALELSEIIKGQAVFNCGTAGHVSHGKSTLVCALTGTKTQRFQKEQEKNITIKLGYANCKLYLNQKTNKIHAVPTTAKEPVLDPDTAEKLVHHSTISFVDCPGHELYMATMISGSKVMDHAIVVIAGNERIPRPQTHHHLVALDYSNITDVSFALNKLDLVKAKDVPEIKTNLDNYLKAMEMGEKPVFPISAVTAGNMSELCQFLAAKVNQRMAKTVQQASQPLRMNLVRSYNVNHPNIQLKDMVGAVVGGTIEAGVLTVGDQVELRPGIICVKDGRKVIQPLVGRVISLESDHRELQTAIPGGLVGVNLSIYSGLSGDDHLKGFVLGHVGSLPDMYDSISGKFKILDIRTPEDDTSAEMPALVKLENGQKIDLIVNGISSVPAEIINCKRKDDGRKGRIELRLKTPVVLNSSNNSIAIMINRKLVAELIVKEGKMSLPVVYPENVDYEWQPPKYRIIDDLIQFTHDPKSFEDMTAELIPTYRQKRIQREIYAYPDVTKVNRSTLIRGSDFQDLVDSMTYGAGAGAGAAAKLIDLKQILLANLASEFPKSEPRFTGDGNLVLDGVILKEKMVRFVDKFVDKLLLCPSCKGTRSTLVRPVGASVQRHCHNCPSVTGLHTTNIGQIA